MRILASQIYPRVWRKLLRAEPGFEASFLFKKTGRHTDAGDRICLAGADPVGIVLREGVSVRYRPPLEAVFGTNVLGVRELVFLALFPLVVQGELENAQVRDLWFKKYARQEYTPSESWNHARPLPISRSRNPSVLSLTSSTIPASTSPGEGSKATLVASVQGPQRIEINSPPPVFLTRHPPVGGSILVADFLEPKTGSVRPSTSRVKISISLVVFFTMIQCHDARPRFATGTLSSVEPRIPIPTALLN